VVHFTLYMAYILRTHMIDKKTLTNHVDWMCWVLSIKQISKQAQMKFILERLHKIWILLRFLNQWTNNFGISVRNVKWNINYYYIKFSKSVPFSGNFGKCWFTDTKNLTKSKLEFSIHWRAPSIISMSLLLLSGNTSTL